LQEFRNQAAETRIKIHETSKKNLSTGCIRSVQIFNQKTRRSLL